MSSLRKNFLLFLLLLGLLGAGAPALSSCARRTAQQRKTKWFKNHHKPGGKLPCPCGH